MRAAAKRYLLFIVLSLSFLRAMGSHIVGGEVTYKYLGSNQYQVSLTIYEDCLTGKPSAIAADNPAWLKVFDASTFATVQTINVDFDTSFLVPANFNNDCLTDPPPICLLKKTFIITVSLPPNASGYIVAYQRCCRNGTIVNIENPENTGSTYYCNIPRAPIVNNSAVFRNFPPQIICLNNPLTYDNSATDADGDSLTYEFCNSLTGGEDNNTPPVPDAPPYLDSVNWVTPVYFYTHPITGTPPLQIDPVSGLITGTPNRAGRYLVTVCCHEWRNGVMINTVKREFQFVVTTCSKVVVACIPQFSTDINTYIVDCSNYTVNFVNCSTGGSAWHWDFGVPGATSDTSTAFSPSFTYPDTGTYAVKLVVNPGSTCPDSIIRLVKIYPFFRANFSDSGRLCPGQPVNFQDLTTSTVRPVNYWKWNFGDGDSTYTENPVHTYAYGGTYNVILVAENARDCIDTIFKQVLIDNFKPFAGNDTVIVKGESVQFSATGGISYAWSPPDYLDETNICNPLGYYPDTGKFTYYVNVLSAFGCIGQDTIQVHVVNQASFFVPSAFTPNGDGLNDVFRPQAVGYRGITYFRVFNRWGQLVYNSNILEDGWDGTFNSKQADMGTYFWEIRFTDRFGKESSLKGDVILIR